jgi:hypothetical protein
MTCQQVQGNLSLYLYGELEFATEEELEEHLGWCALCQLAFEREKTWHTAVNAEKTDVPLDFLSSCRRELRTALSSSRAKEKARPKWLSWFDFSSLSGMRWSMQLATASFLLLTGFTAARWMDQNGLSHLAAGSEVSQMGLIDAASAHVRDIQPGEDNRVRIVFDQVRPREIIGRVEDRDVRQLLLAAMKDPTDPGIRVDSVEVLKGQNGSDVRDALIDSAWHDSNAAVRLKALDGLRRFSNDPETREAVKYVLQHDADPGVRSEAIDVLVPANGPVEFSPELAGTLQQIMRSQGEDDYVRMRSAQILQMMKASLTAY